MWNKSDTDFLEGLIDGSCAVQSNQSSAWANSASVTQSYPQGPKGSKGATGPRGTSMNATLTLTDETGETFTLDAQVLKRILEIVKKEYPEDQL